MDANSARDSALSSKLLWIAQKYQVDVLVHLLVKTLSRLWPRTLDQWDASGLSTSNEPDRSGGLHPLLIIKVARLVGSSLQHVLPSVFYWLCTLSTDEILGSREEYPTDVMSSLVGDQAATMSYIVGVELCQNSLTGLSDKLLRQCDL